MGLMKLCLCLLLMVVAAAPHSFAFPEISNDLAHAYGGPDFPSFRGYAPAEVAKGGGRLLYQYGYSKNYSHKKYLSNNALKYDNIPCGRRGSSYYDCRKHTRLNPYRRGCSANTGCARFLD